MMSLSLPRPEDLRNYFKTKGWEDVVTALDAWMYQWNLMCRQADNYSANKFYHNHVQPAFDRWQTTWRSHDTPSDKHEDRITVNLIENKSGLVPFQWSASTNLVGAHGNSKAEALCNLAYLMDPGSGMVFPVVVNKVRGHDLSYEARLGSSSTTDANPYRAALRILIEGVQAAQLTTPVGRQVFYRLLETRRVFDSWVSTLTPAIYDSAEGVGPTEVQSMYQLAKRHLDRAGVYHPVDPIDPIDPKDYAADFDLTHLGGVPIGDVAKMLTPDPAPAVGRITPTDEPNPAEVPTQDEWFEQVVHPAHYQGKTMEVWDVIEAFDLGFNLGNTFKYMARRNKKENAIKDLLKAVEYLNHEILLLRKEQDNAQASNR